MSNRRFVPIVCCLSVMAAWSCHASDPFNVKEGNELLLSVRAEVGQDDNLLYSDQHKQRESFLKLVPTANMQTQFERHLLTLSAQAEHVQYDKQSDNNHSNVKLSSGYQYRFSANQGLFVQGQYHDQYQPRGTGLSLGQPLLLAVGDRKTSAALTTGFLYGQKSSTAKLKLAIGVEQERYQTRRETTRVFDSESIYLNPTFDYLLGGGSYFASELKLERLEFNNNFLQNRDKYVALLGFKWLSSEITELAALVGYQEIQFKESILPNDDAIKWRVNLNWNPLEDLRFILSSERDFTLANRLQNSYRLVDNYSLSLAKKWRDDVNILAELSYSQEDVIAPELREQEDYFSAMLELQYIRNSWLMFFIRFHAENLDAEAQNYDYQKNSFLLGLNVTL